MESIKSVYKIGPGPSSSHTIGPYNIAKDFLNRYQDFDSIVVDLYGSLALTGKGHGTDKILLESFKDFLTKINFHFSFDNIDHPNTLDISAFKKNELVAKERYYSIGGGEIERKGEKKLSKK